MAPRPQFFWHLPMKSAWHVTFTRFDNDTAAPPPVEALGGPRLKPQGPFNLTGEPPSG